MLECWCCISQGGWSSSLRDLMKHLTGRVALIIRHSHDRKTFTLTFLEHVWNTSRLFFTLNRGPHSCGSWRIFLNTAVSEVNLFAGLPSCIYIKTRMKSEATKHVLHPARVPLFGRILHKVWHDWNNNCTVNCAGPSRGSRRGRRGRINPIISGIFWSFLHNTWGRS